MNLITTRLIQQMNGKYKLQAFEGSFLIRELWNLDLKEAAKKIEEIMEEGRNATSS